jgi:hypothetical protein
VVQLATPAGRGPVGCDDDRKSQSVTEEWPVTVAVTTKDHSAHFAVLVHSLQHPVMDVSPEITLIFPDVPEKHLFSVREAHAAVLTPSKPGAAVVTFERLPGGMLSAPTLASARRTHTALSLTVRHGMGPVLQLDMIPPRFFLITQFHGRFLA